MQNTFPDQLDDIDVAMYFQHDGAPNHYWHHVSDDLNTTFLNLWIEFGNIITGPKRSSGNTQDKLFACIMDAIAGIKESQDDHHQATHHLTLVENCRG